MRVTSLRNAKLEPRSTMPSAASESGTNSVSVIDANASENPVHSTTRQKISHTWLASHTGPIECADHRARALAPLGAAGDEVPEPGAEVGAAEHRVRGDAEEQDDRDDVGHQTPTGSSVARRAVGGRLARAVRPAGLELGRRPRGTAGSSRAASASGVTATPT